MCVELQCSFDSVARFLRGLTEWLREPVPGTTEIFTGSTKGILDESPIVYASLWVPVPANSIVEPQRIPCALT